MRDPGRPPAATTRGLRRRRGLPALRGRCLRAGPRLLPRRPRLRRKFPLPACPAVHGDAAPTIETLGPKWSEGRREVPDHRRFALVAFAATLLLALPGRATSPSPGTVRLLSAPERPYRSLQLAIDAARDGDIVRLGPGTFDEAIRVAGKDLRLVGAGVGETTLRGPGALLTVAADARVRVESLTLACTARGGAKPLSGRLRRGRRLLDVGVRSARRRGLRRRDREGLTATSRSSAAPSSVAAAVSCWRKPAPESSATSSQMAAAPALLLGTPPALPAPVLVEHNTLLAGEGPEEPPLLAARVPGGEPRVTFGYNVVSGAVPAELLVPLSRDTLDYANVAVTPLDRRSFFEDLEEGDYRPSDAQKKDAAGLEMGARLSADGAEDLRPAVEDALDQGRISEGLRLIRWLPGSERGPYLDGPGPRSTHASWRMWRPSASGWRCATSSSCRPRPPRSGASGTASTLRCSASCRPTRPGSTGPGPSRGLGARRPARPTPGGRVRRRPADRAPKARPCRPGRSRPSSKPH